GRLQRLRLLRPRVPVRGDRPARAARRGPARAVRRQARRPRVEVHSLLRPHEGRPRARLREGLPDGLDPVRAARRAARARGAAAREAAVRGVERRAALRRGRTGRRRRLRRVLPPPRRARGLRAPARPGRAHPAAARAVRRGRRGRRGARGRSRRRAARRPAVSVRDGSVTRPRGEARSYYGRPILKEPVWKPEIPLYLFAGGLAGASSVLGFAARVTGRERLARTSLWVGLAGELASPALLVADLGRPERFLNMLRVFKVTSPMSVGSWVLAGSGAATTAEAACEALGILPCLRLVPAAASAALGGPLATYTAALLADTAVPV